MKSTSEMPFCRKPIPLIFSIKSKCKTRGLSPSIMWKTAMSRSCLVIFIRRYRKKIMRRVKLHSVANRKKSIYSSKYALSSIVYCSKCGEIYQRIAWIMVENIPACGGAVPVWNMDQLPVMCRLFRRQSYRRL